MVRPLGVVLAGGSSRRMGRDKAEVELAGRSMGRWVVAALSAVCPEVVAAGRERLGELPGVPDAVGGQAGPLAGLVGVAQRHPDRPLLLVAVDQPWVRTETLRRLSGLLGDRPVAPVADGVRQTTCAAYPAGLGELARKELEAGGSLQSLLDRTSFDPVVEEEWRRWGEDGRSWFSADTPVRLAEGLARFGAPSDRAS